jgi:cytochrome c peroxidase
MPTKKTKVILSLVISVSVLIIACSKDETEIAQEDLVAKYLNLPATPYNYANPSLPAYLSAPPIQGQINTPAGNQITDLGATLGRVLFYDKSLSKNRTISCASCHKQENAFSDFEILSKGFNGGSTGRNSMSLIDAKYYPNGMFFLGPAGCYA